MQPSVKIVTIFGTFLLGHQNASTIPKPRWVAVLYTVKTTSDLSFGFHAYVSTFPPFQSFRFSSPLVLVAFSSEFHFGTVGKDPIIPVLVNLLEMMLKSTLEFSLLLLGLLLNIK